MTNNKNLFDNFSAVSKTAWISKLEKDLKGRPYEELHWTIGDITLEPIYHNDENIATTHLDFGKENNDWEIGEDFAVGDDFKMTNKSLLLALQNGVNAPRLLFKNAPDVDSWTVLLDGINLNYISLHLHCDKGTEVFKAMVSLMTYLEGNGYEPATLKGSIQTKYATYFNPVVMGDFMKMVGHPLTNFKILTVNATAFYKGIDGTVDELYQTIKEGNLLLDLFTGMDSNYTKASLEDVAKKIQFSIAIGTSYFVSIAKIRALHILWANVLKAYGIEATTYIDAHFAADSQDENINTNMIRATTQAMSAVIGGINRLTVLPANVVVEEATDFSRRIARNVQHLLKMESHLDIVQDPAAGSYYIEKLTEELAEKAWKKFQSI